MNTGEAKVSKVTIIVIGKVHRSANIIVTVRDGFRCTVTGRRLRDCINVFNLLSALSNRKTTKRTIIKWSVPAGGDVLTVGLL